MAALHCPRDIIAGKHRLLTTVAALGLLAAAVPAGAYTPQVFDAIKDTGQDFTKVPMSTAPLGSGGINQKVWNNIWGNQFWFSGGTTGLWITSNAAAKWPNTGIMQQTSSCAAGFGYGDFHWRAAIANANQGPGENMIMWPADGDPAWPGVIKNSDDNHIGEVDISETNYARNGTSFATFHFYNGTASGHNGQIMHLPITFPTGSMTSMHDYDEIWGPGSLVLKVDGVVQMSAPPTQVRADYAHGGCNYTLGAQMAMQATSYDVTPTVGLYLANMWWSATDGSAGSGTSTPISQPSPTPAPSSTPAAALTGSLPSPLYTGTQTVSGKGGKTGLQLEPVSSGTYNAPGSTGWVKAKVNSDGSWTAALPFTGAGKTTHVFAAQGGSSAVIDLVDGTPLAPPAASTPAPTPTPTPTPAGLAVRSVVEDSGRLLMTGSKEIGHPATLREYMDGTYLGVLRDNFADGAFSMHIADVTAGSHVLKLTLDGSSATASFAFKK